MRIYVRIQKGASELYEDLASLPSSCRAERLRILASIGLALMRGQGQPPPPAKTTPRPKPQNESPAGNSVANKLLQSVATDHDEEGEQP